MTDGIRVRQASREDLEAIRRCLAAAFEPYRARYTHAAFEDTVLTVERAERRLREMAVLVAEDERKDVVGTIGHALAGSGEGHLRGMAVDPRHQGRGIAEQLLKAAEEGLLRQGCTRVTLDTTEPLEPAIRFYRRHGYEPTGTVRDFYGMPVFEYAKTVGR